MSVVNDVEVIATDWAEELYPTSASPKIVTLLTNRSLGKYRILCHLSVIDCKE